MTNFSLILLIILPILGACGAFFLGRFDLLRKKISIVILFLSLLSAVYLATKGYFSWSGSVGLGYVFTLGLDKLSRLVIVFANLFGFLICLYSKDYIEGKRHYFSWLLLLIAFSNLEILAADFVIFSLAWAGSIVMLYLLLNLGSRFSANKAGVIMGFSYLCFILGAFIYCSFTKTNSMFAGSIMVLNHPLSWLALLLMLVGALAKAGCGPLHTWIPTASESAPATVMAILPASLDKLLGIYI